MSHDDIPAVRLSASEPAPALDAPIRVDACVGDLHSETIDHPCGARLATTLRAYVGCSWNHFDLIETVQFVEPDYARITYLDVAHDNARRTCGFGF